MKKIITLLLVLSLVLGLGIALISCKPNETFEIALVTDVGNIDDKSFNEGAWNGVKQYAEANDKTYAYYRPSEDSEQARLDSIAAAIDNGAKIVVCPGYLFQTVVYTAQATYPEVAFVLLDAEPNDDDWSTGSPTYRTDDNVHNILYKEEQSGFLAGYATVMDGMRDLGFIGGMEVPAVQRFGHGFILGAEAAATELELADDSVNMKYWYCGTFGPRDDIRTKATQWYTGGEDENATEVIFACGGGIYLSILESAKAAGKPIIGVDVDQRAAIGETKEVVITSAEKKLTESVVIALTSYYTNGGAWDEAHAGTTSNLGAVENSIGLPTSEDSWGFTNFTVEEYEELFDKLVDGTIVVDNSITDLPTTTKVTTTLEE